MEPCWHVLVSLWKQYFPKWLVAGGDCGIDSKHSKKPLQPPDPQQLFQAADQEADNTVVLTGPKNYVVPTRLRHYGFCTHMS